MGKYRLIERKANPLDKQDKTIKFYAKPVYERPMKTSQFAKNASVGMAITPKEMEAAVDQFNQYAVQLLLMGRTVEIPGIGFLRISFKSEGAESPDKFNARTMISSPRIIFTANNELRKTIRDGMTYENVGVRAGGKDYTSIGEYMKTLSPALPL